MMALTLSADKKQSTLMGKMCSLLPLDHRIHKSVCFMFKGFFLNRLLPKIRTHLMRENIKDPRKLAAKVMRFGNLPPTGVSTSILGLSSSSCPQMGFQPLL